MSVRYLPWSLSEFRKETLPLGVLGRAEIGDSDEDQEDDDEAARKKTA